MRRIQRATDKEDVVRRLTSGDHLVFKEIWRLMLFAALLGYRNQCRITLGKVDSGKGIDARVFDNSPVWPGILHLIALVENPTPEALSTEAEESRLQIFEEYANGGLAILEELFESKSYSQDSLIAFVHEYACGEVVVTGDDLSDLTL